MAAKEKSQSEKFIEKAKELGADESAEGFERAFRTVVTPSRKQQLKTPSHKKTGHHK